MKRIVCLVFMFIVAIDISKSSTLSHDFYENVVEANKFTKQNLINYISRKEIKHPDIVYAQAILETGNFKSKIFKENNNLFGMKFVDTLRCKKVGAKYRPTVAVGERYDHAYYENWKKSVDDYLLWQKMFKRTPTKTEQQYMKLLDDRYAIKGKYAPVLQKIVAQVKQNKNI